MTDAPASLSWITRLMEIDTTSRGSNLPLIEVVADALRELGLEPHVLPAADQEGKANLVVTVPDRDGNRSGGVVLSGHTDVVPVDGQDWTSEPFSPEVRDERLYGRGSADMKGFIGAALHALPMFMEADLTEPVHLALSYDEEIGCHGGRQLVKDFADLGLSPATCIVGEPTSMRMIAAHKAMSVITATFTGVAAHSSLTPQGVNAIEYAARFVTHARAVADRFAKEGPFDEAYVVPHTTMSVNQISGGIAQNTVPDRCVVTLEFRAIDGDDPADITADLQRCADALAAQMSAQDERAGVEFVVESEVPGLETDTAATGARLVAEVLAASGSTVADQADKVTYGTEAGLFSGAGIDTVVLGPGDIAQAHAADEYVDLEQIRECERFFAALAEHLSA
ncbi:MAG: acetylornithine deacetylase [Mobilicoccus sp.]|nr:acetylornithine deacetylase [Mobilicoccus sp.]